MTDDKKTYYLSWQEAEKITGARLDRRYRYWAYVSKPVHEITIEDLHIWQSWTEPCSGCTRSYEEAGAVQNRGIGCDECGYRGVRRSGIWMPYLDIKKWAKGVQQ